VSIPHTLFSIHNLKQIVLDRNYWHCDCNLGIFQSELVRKKVHIAQETKCTTPSSFAGKFWNEFESDQFTCPPSLKMPNLKQEVSPGRNLSLYCQAGGNPIPRLIWKHNDEFIPIGWRDGEYNINVTNSVAGPSSEVFSVLLIKNLTSFTNGKYTCKAENEVGTEEKSLLINIDSVPEEMLLTASSDPSILIALCITAFTIISILVIIICFMFFRRRGSAKKVMSNRSLLLKDSHKKQPPPSLLNPLPRINTGIYDNPLEQFTSLSRCSTDSCNNCYSESTYDEVFLPNRLKSDSRRSISKDGCSLVNYSETDVLARLVDRPGSRSSIGSSSFVVPNPQYWGSLRRSAYSHPPASQRTPRLSHDGQRPGYVTIARRSVSNRPVLYELGPRSKGDGCSLTTNDSFSVNTIMASNSYNNQICSSRSNTAINTLGIPVVDGIDGRCSTPSSIKSHSLHLGTIQENENTSTGENRSSLVKDQECE